MTNIIIGTKKQPIIPINLNPSSINSKRTPLNTRPEAISLGLILYCFCKKVSD